MRIFLVLSLILSLFACSQKQNTIKIRFERLSAKESQIDFRNDLTFDSTFNIYTYRNFYNGGGVGIGDFNQDGLEDIYFTSNQGDNQLYLNLGEFKFDNITTSAKVGGARKWSAGVSIVDVNADGLLDIYVCNSGDIDGDDKQNELFINQGLDQEGIPVFKEDAATYGLADEGHSTHAAFFDYDKDGDLDCYLLNNSYRPIGSFNLKKNERLIRSEKGGDKLLRNDDGIFVDVSESAGIYGSIIGFGLGVTVGDVNDDDYEDIYVSNDFFERDYLYINQRDGTFMESSEAMMDATSSASMGADMGDLNNDSHPEIFVTDMLPRTSARYQSKTTFEDWNKYRSNVENDYYKQFTRNSLQWNSGGTSFQEVSRMTDVSATDWSWGALIFDMNMDGFKDIFVANGIYQDLTDQDYIRYAANSETVRQMVRGGKVDFEKLIAAIPSEPIPNYAFINSRGKLEPFKEESRAFGLDEPGFSNGAAYADLDNDGDYDLIVNNVNEEAWVYKNNTVANYLKFRLKGKGSNPFAIGAKVLVYQKNGIQNTQLIPQKGFQSSVSYDVIFGVDKENPVDSVVVKWPDLTSSSFMNLQLDSLHVIDQKSVKTNLVRPSEVKQKLKFVTIDFQHTENDYSDFDKDQLAFFMRSTLGPAGTARDVDGDGIEDLYIGGAAGQAGRLYLQNRMLAFDEDSKSEDVASHFFDADQDGDLDLYVCSGSSEFSATSFALFDRLYVNDGEGNFAVSSQRLPLSTPIFSSCVKSSDIDGDGDLDLVVGEAYRSSAHGIPRSLFLLENDGKGKFSVKNEWKEMGMIREVEFVDIDNDNDEDLLVVGEWMSILIIENQNGVFAPARALPESAGFWNTIAKGDFNGDGYIDFMAGNMGTNHPWQERMGSTFDIMVNDFDQTGGIDVVFTIDSMPINLKHDLEKQMPSIKKKFNSYSEFTGKKMSALFPSEVLNKSLIYPINEMASCLFINDKKGGFIKRPLPVDMQVSPTFAILAHDINDDGLIDAILGGNLSEIRPEVGAMNTGKVVVLLNQGLGQFQSIPLDIKGDVRGILSLNNEFVILRNNDTPVKVRKAEVKDFVGRAEKPNSIKE